MGHKTAGTEGPQCLVQLFCPGFLVNLNVNVAFHSAGLIDQSAGDSLSIALIRIPDKVKIYLGYGFCPARLIRYWVKSPTGLPVEPLVLPLFHAVPAMSR